MLSLQSKILHTLDLYFRVNNGDDGGSVRLIVQYHLHLPQVLVVVGLFQNQLSLTAASTAKFELYLVRTSSGLPLSSLWIHPISYL